MTPRSRCAGRGGFDSATAPAVNERGGLSVNACSGLFACATRHLRKQRNCGMMHKEAGYVGSPVTCETPMSFWLLSWLRDASGAKTALDSPADAPARRAFARPKKAQRGETLIGLLLAAGLAAAALGVAMQMQQRSQERLDAQQGGVLLAQTADGLRRLISAAPGNMALVPTAAQTGVNWLKAPGCGGLPANPAQGFVPCSFGDNFWTPAFSTTFTNVAGRIEARITFVVPAAYSRPRAGVLADIIAEHANANLTTSVVNAPAPGVITPGFVTVMSHVRPADNSLVNRLAIRADQADPDFARLVVSVSNDPSTDGFLRTDGTNRMNAALNLNNNNLVGGADLGAQTATLAGGLTAQTATITDRVTANMVNLRAGTAGAAQGAACTENGLVASDANGLLFSCQGGAWLRVGTQRVNSWGQSCPQSGAHGEMADGTAMICQGATWIPLQLRMGGIIQVGSFLVRNGVTVPKPDCGALNAAARIFVKPRTWFDGPVTLNATSPPLTLTSTVSNIPWGYAATDQGASWRVDITAPRGVPQSEAIAITACAFS